MADFAALDRDHLQEAEDEITSLLRAYRHLRPGKDDNFGIQSSDSLVSTWDQLTGAIASAAVGVVSIFMLVGGVVIMNIMLAVVSERTREIGVRKSLGARRRDILLQFLIEACVIAAVGGLIGVLIAVGLSQAIQLPIAMAATAANLHYGNVDLTLLPRSMSTPARRVYSKQGPTRRPMTKCTRPATGTISEW